MVTKPLCEKDIKGKMVDKEKKRSSNSEGERESKPASERIPMGPTALRKQFLRYSSYLQKGLSTWFLPRKKTKNLRKYINDGIHSPFQDYLRKVF